MHRLTVGFDDEQLEWIEARADAEDRSNAEIVRRAVDAMRTDANHTDAMHTDANRTGAVRDELEALRERVAALEADRGAVDEKAGSAGRSSGRAPRGSDGENPPAEWQGHVLGEVDSPGFRKNPEAFMDAIAAAVELLEDGPRSKSEFVDDVYPNHAVDYDNTDTWWRRVGRPGLKAHPDVAAPKEGRSKWRLSR